MTRPADRPPRLLRSLARRFGYDLVARGPARPRIVDAFHEGVAYRFFVEHAHGDVQSAHARGGLYEPEALALIAAHLPRGGAMLDLGANVGNHAVHAARGLGAGLVVALEPNPLAARMLEINVRLNAVEDVVETHRAAASDAPGTLSFTATDHHALSMGRVAERGGDHVQVAARRADDVLDGRRVDVAKIDVEGHEMQALAGLAATVARWRTALYVEVDDANAAARPRDSHGRRSRRRRRRSYDVNENLLVLPE